MMFSLEGIGVQWYILPMALIGSFFMSTFWCRFFCPVGHGLRNLLQLRKKTLDVFKTRILHE
jgi:polyferredoxin